jgi:ABC-type transporter Mla subunit MlaD
VTAGDIIKRILGLIMMIVALAIIILSIIGAFRVGDAIASVTASIESTLRFTSESLTTAADTVTLTQDTIREVGTGLDTASTATANLSGAIADSRPFLSSVSVIISEDLPANLEAVQAALPNVVQVAGVIDRTLTTLSSIGIDQTIDLPFGQSIPLQWDLGIDYDPGIPFDQTIGTFESTLDGLPESLRDLEGDLTTTTDNLGVLADNLLTISDDLDTINQNVNNLVPLLDQYTVLIGDLQTAIDSALERIQVQLDALRMGVIIGLALLALSQLAGLYLGYELLSGRREERVTTVMVTPPLDKVNPESL